MLRQILQIPYMKDLVKRLRRDPCLRRMCGYGGRAPCEAHFSQMKSRIGPEGFRMVEAHLRHEALRIRGSQPLAAVGLIQAASLDGTDLPAWSSRDPHDNTRGFGDPDARLGRGPEGFYLGYQSLFMVDMEGFPLGHVEAPANVNEKEMAEQLLEDVLGEDFEVELAAGDSQLESQRVFHMLEQRKIEHLIPWRRLRGRMNPPGVLTVKDRIQVEGPEHKRVVYGRLRARVESFISTLKNHLAYDNFTWKGLESASVHTSLALCVFYAVSIATSKLGRPDLMGSVSYFA